jgi:hypothetical protein
MHIFFCKATKDKKMSEKNEIFWIWAPSARKAEVQRSTFWFFFWVVVWGRGLSADATNACQCLKVHILLPLLLLLPYHCVHQPVLAQRYTAHCKGCLSPALAQHTINLTSICHDLYQQIYIKQINMAFWSCGKALLSTPYSILPLGSLPLAKQWPILTHTKFLTASGSC